MKSGWLSLWLFTFCLLIGSYAPAQANTPPTLTSIGTLTNAYEDSTYYVNYPNLSAAANEADVDGDAISFRVEEVLSGTLTKNGAAITPGNTLLSAGETLAWTPAANENGLIAAFSVVAYDGTDVSSPPVTVNINVNPFDDTPTLNAIANQTINEDSNLTLSLTGITSGAPNEDQSLTVTATVQSVTGAPTANVTASVDYTSPQNTALLNLNPAPNTYGSVIVTVTVSDGHVPSPNYPRTDKSTFTLSVLSVNDAPTLDALPDLTINEDSGPVTVNLSGISSGAANENQNLTLRASINFPPYLLTSSTIPFTYTSPQSTGTLTLNLIANANGSAPVTVSVTDGQATTTRTFNLTVVAVNDAPTLTTMLPLRWTDEDRPYTVVLNALLNEGNEADVDGPSMSFRIEQVLSGVMTQNGQPIVPGQTVVNANQSAVWTPPANQYGDIPAFTVRAFDTIDLSATEVTVAVRVNSINDYPYAASNQPISTVEDTPVQLPLPATDNDGQTVTYTFSGLIAGSSVTGTAPNLMYNPKPNATGFYQFAYTATDGLVNSYGSFVVNISPVNDAPTLTLMNPLKGGTEDQYYIVDLGDLTFEGNEADVDGPSMSFRIEEIVSGSLTQNGQFVVPGQAFITSSQSATWIPPSNVNGNVVAFRVRAYDGSLASSDAIDVPIALAPVNDAPVAQSSTVSGTEDTPLPLNLNAIDVDGDTLTYEFYELSDASITGTAPDLVYTPPINRNGQVSFVFRVKDATLYSAYVRVYVNLAPAPDAPTLTTVAPFTQGQEDTSFYISHYMLWQNANEYQPDYSPNSQPILAFRIEEVLSGTLTKGNQPVVPGQTILSQQDANYPLIWTPPANANGTINAFTIKAWDGINASATAVPVPVQVKPLNDAPVAQDPAVVTNEDVAVDFNLEATDVDGDALTYSIINQPPTSAGVISGTGPYTFTPTANFSGQAGFSFTVSDGITTTYRQGTFINVTAVNDAPTLSSIATLPNAMQGKPYTVSLQQLRAYSDLADVDHDLNSVRFRIESLESGTLTSNGAPVQPGFLIDDGDPVTWTPPLDALGVTTAFRVKAWDGNLASSTAVPVRFDVASANNAPEAQAQSVALNEDSSSNITLVASDADNEALTYGIFINPSHGVLSGTAPNLTYTPNANYNGSDAFWFVANDGKVDSVPAKISLTINSVNDAPTISRLTTKTGNEDTIQGFMASLVINGSDGADVDGNAVFLKIESLGVGALRIGNVDAYVGQPIYSNDYFYWVPPANANGELTVATVRAFDGALTSVNTVPLKFNLAPVNDRPTAQGLTVYMSEDETFSRDLVGSDIENDALTFRITQQPQHGTLSGTLPNFIYTPEANYVGDDTFRFVSNDGALDSTEANIVFHLANINDAPTLESVTTLEGAFEDTPFDITFATLQNAADEADVDNASIAFRVESVEAGTLTKNGVVVTAGTLFNAGENLRWTPPANASGTGNAFTVKAWDGQLASAIAVPVNISVEAISDAPVAQAQSVNTNEDQAVNITLQASDADGDALTYAVVTQPQHGTLTGTAPNLIYTPAADYSGSDSFTFRAKGDIESNEAVVSITIAPQNDAPVALSQIINATEDVTKAITLGASDVENNALTYVVGSPQHGTLSGTAPNLLYTPNADYNGADSFTFKANDGVANSNTATVTINVAPVNDAPTASNQTVAASEDTAQPVTLSGNDTEGDALTYVIVAGPAHGMLTGSGANRTYTPAADYSGADSFTFQVNDGSANSNTATVTINIAAVNDAPTLTAINTLPGGLEDQALTISYATLAAAANEADIESTNLAFRIESVSGTLTKNGITAILGQTLIGSGDSVVWTPTANANGTISAFTVKAWDGQAASAMAIAVNITVTSVNDAPSFTLPVTALSIAKNSAAQTRTGWATNISAGPADESAQTKTFTVTNNSASLFSTQPAISSTGTMTFTPAKSKAGTATVTVRLQDSGGTSNGGVNLSGTQTFTITIK